MSIQINETDVINDSRKGIFQSANVGAFSNPTRPGSAATGDIIYSTTDSKLQVWNGSSWVNAADSTPVNINPFLSGGTAYTDGQYTTRVFTSPVNFVVSTTNPITIEYAIIAGGGGSGGSGGGGSGGLITGSTTLSPGTYPISIGAAGGNTTTQGNNGGNTSFNGLTSIGGGGGGGANWAYSGRPGGSGGGRGDPYNGAGSGTPGQGYPGSPPYGGGTAITGGGGYSIFGSNQGRYSPFQGKTSGGDGFKVKWGLPAAVRGTNVNSETVMCGGGSHSGSIAPGVPSVAGATWPLYGSAYGSGGGYSNSSGNPNYNNPATLGSPPSTFNAGPGAVLIRYLTNQRG
jgi:hypothetical protein